MIKLIFAGAMASATEVERIRRYIPEQHAPLVVSVPAASDPMYRYVLHLSIPGKKDTAFGLPVKEEYFNVVEMIFENARAVAESRQKKEFQEIIVADEQRMGGDFNDTLAHFLKEVEIVRGPSWPITLYHFLKRGAGLTREAFQGRWRDQQTALIGSGGQGRQIRRYVQNHVLPAGSLPMGTNDEGFDIIDEYHFESLDDMASFNAENPKRAGKIAEGHETLTDKNRSFAQISQGITFIERPFRAES
jgi:hypothetical protein